MWEIRSYQFYNLENSYIFQALKVLWEGVSLKHTFSIHNILLGTLPSLSLRHLHFWLDAVVDCSPVFCLKLPFS